MPKIFHRLAALAVASAAALGLSACSAGDVQSEQSDQQSGQSQSELAAKSPPVDRDPQGDLPAIDLREGRSAPVMEPADGPPPKEITAEVLEAGDGPEIGPDDVVTANYTGYLWDGEQFDSSFRHSAAQSSESGEGPEAASVPLVESLNRLVPGWKWGLAGTHVGDQVLLVIPPQWAYGDQDRGPIPADSTLVFVVNVTDAVSISTDVLAEAKPTGAELPAGLSVSGSLAAEPKVEFTREAPEPKTQEKVVLAEGQGPVVTDSDAVEAHCVFGDWGSAPSSSTWADGRLDGFQPQPGSLLTGQKVGSRVLYLSPADGEHPAEYTLLDIVAAYQK